MTVCVPFRPGMLDREIHADYVSARLREMLPDAHHLVVDVDGEFSRARVRNEAVRRAGSGVVVLCDADTLPEEGALRDAINGAAGDGRLHLPYTRYRALSPEGTLAVYARGVDPMDAPVEDESRRPIGGVWVISVDAYWAVGGMDEEFKGWGFEDDAFHTAANCLLGETVRHEGTITHLHHKPAANLRSPSYRANRARHQQYVRARRSPEAMRRLTGAPNPTRRRIVALAHYYLPTHRAGAEIMLHELLKALAERGHQVEAWATDEEQDAVVDGITVRAGVPESVDADVVVSHLKSVPLARKLAKKAGARFVLLAHSAAPWVVKDVRAGADLVVANSEHVARDLRHRSETLIVHPPVYADRHRTRPGRRVTLINPISAKGSEVFYELARRMPEVGFLAVEGGYQQAEQVRKRLPNVRWQSHTADMRGKVWSHTKVLLVPSAEESYGMVAVEAAASGIPTIAAPTAGLREALGDAGTFADVDDIDAWETALRDLLGVGWRTASKKALARSAELDPRKEVGAWVDAIESL
ncbi:glycosyltransferase [Nocardiopsis sp. NPDC058789]|uniref:glycosyltransferase n=1 Tax=Nocardiopsis sp. NPDC058789 TaxID=3346634 RepID=UPI00366ABD7E